MNYGNLLIIIRPTNIRYGVYNSTKEVLKTFHSAHDDKYKMFCVKKMMTIAIRTSYYIICCRNKEWENPELLAF